MCWVIPGVAVGGLADDNICAGLYLGVAVVGLADDNICAGLYLGVAVGGLADDNIWLQLLQPPDEVDHVGTSLRPKGKRHILCIIMMRIKTMAVSRVIIYFLLCNLVLIDLQNAKIFELVS